MMPEINISGFKLAINFINSLAKEQECKWNEGRNSTETEISDGWIAMFSTLMISKKLNRIVILQKIEMNSCHRNIFNMTEEIDKIVDSQIKFISHED
jgi:hypothetical protein